MTLVEPFGLRNSAQIAPPQGCLRVPQKLPTAAGIRRHLALPAQRLQQRHLPEGVPAGPGTETVRFFVVKITKNSRLCYGLMLYGQD